MKELAYLNKYIVKYKYYLLLGIFFTIVSNLFGIIPAQLVRESLDTVKSSLQDFEAGRISVDKSLFIIEITKKISYFGLLILGMAILKGVFLFAVRQTLIVMSRHIEFDMKNEIYAHYQTLPMSFYKKNQTGDLMARISEDVSKVRMYIGPSIMYLLNMVVLVFLIIGYMLSVNIRLTCFVLIPMPILSLSIFLVSSRVNKKSEQIQKSLSKVSSFSQEAFSGIRLIKAFNSEGSFVQNFKIESLNYRKKSFDLANLDALFSPVVGFLIGLCTVICVYVGGQEVMANRLSTGNIAEFIIYVFMLTWPLTALGWTSGQIQRAAASQKRINEFLNTKTEIVSKANKTTTIDGDIQFENVSFTYEDTGIEALRDISFEVKQGQTIAILGTTGSGKSTLANLLLRLYDKTSGNIKLNGLDIEDFEVQYLRSQFSYVPQDVFLFSDTVKQNIGFADRDLKDPQIIEAAKVAYVHDNIESFENKYDTIVGERGITLSGGQKQRISIARALVKSSKIWILDDCLSAVDTETEAQILNQLSTYKGKKTIFIISHRVSNAKFADKILFFDGAELMESGSHEELLQGNGSYKEMYELQMMELSN